MSFFSSLNREQKNAIGILQAGTFLEFFDLLLYVHMAVFLNDLFFPTTDPQTASLLAAFAFCSTFVFRPIGALFFGWLGDKFGRKSTIVITTLIMSLSCIIMANVPTYAQIGIAATWIMIICRMAQGISSMGEIVGAQIYIAESVTRPAAYPAVAIVTVSAAVGGMVALGVASLVTSFGFNWRAAFWAGAIIAIVGSIARTYLRETPDFLEMKRQQLEIQFKESDQYLPKEERVSVSRYRNEKVEKKTSLSYFFIYSGWALCFYMAFIYFNPLLKLEFNYTSSDIIQHNFILSVCSVCGSVFVTYLSYYIHPLKILRTRGFFIFGLMIIIPFIISNLTSPYQLLIIQALILLSPLDGMPADAVLLYHFPIFRRFTYTSFIFSFSRAVVYIITSFGLIYLTNYFGPYGLYIICLPITVAFLWSVNHFEKLEHELGIFRSNPFFNLSRK